MNEEVISAVRERLVSLCRQLRTAESLSEPCPAGRWRWADVNLGGYGCKSEEELAADRARNRSLALELRQRIASLESWLAEQDVS